MKGPEVVHGLFALQLCAFRYPGQLLASGEVIPEAVSSFIAAQLGKAMDELCRYAETDVTRRRHSLLQDTALIADDEKPETRPVGFLRRGSKWHRRLNAEDGAGHQLWEVAGLFHFREAFRSGDIWLRCTHDALRFGRANLPPWSTTHQHPAPRRPYRLLSRSHDPASDRPTATDPTRRALVDRLVQ